MLTYTPGVSSVEKISGECDADDSRYCSYCVCDTLRYQNEIVYGLHLWKNNELPCLCYLEANADSKGKKGK